MRFTFVLAVVAALTASISASDAVSDAIGHAQDAKEDFAASLYASSVAAKFWAIRYWEIEMASTLFGEEAGGREVLWFQSRFSIWMCRKQLSSGCTVSSSDLDNFARVGCAVTYFAKSDASWRFHMRIPQNIAQVGIHDEGTEGGA
ncbi:uncharacterized protein F5891DRAFT_979883 [Suillus fuscotomentosus]|uniref:Uncharacterized protein n=1 Tax=Suillus fuscotomentosus TaxID=1912939 RepID=A0AAD4E7Z9_9AGAM|nr:uncharacterized protein F5891DRAFT_979883 [Suillus fuscotomentosus]KAG1900991.1 hypothetical protein F5891DRAFT_979883 [Suillus fuscotomentosus]